MERAKEFTKSGNKQAAMQCLKRKKYYESQMNQVGSVQLRINTKEKMIADHSGNKEDKWNQSSEYGSKFYPSSYANLSNCKQWVMSTSC